MKRSEELIKYLGKKLATLSGDLKRVKDKDSSWYFARAIVEILVIQTQVLIALSQEKKDEKTDGER